MDRPQKSVLRAYLWLIALGVLGAHRFYLNRASTGLLFAVMSVAGAVAVIFGLVSDQADIRYLGYSCAALVLAALLVDLVSIPGMVEELNNPGEERRMAVIAGDLDPSFQATARRVGRDDPDRPQKSALGDDYERPWRKDKARQDVYRPGED